jgi:hypothetical protein
MLSDLPVPIHSTFEHIVFYSLQSGFVLGLAKLIWGAAKLQTTVDTVLTNHLPHLDEKIDGVRDDVKEVRQEFIRHIQGAVD